MERVEGYILLTVRFAREGDQWTAECQELGTAACGDTLEEAEGAIKDLIELHLNSLEELGERAAFFEKHGIKFHRTRPEDAKRRIQVRPGEFVTCLTERVFT